MSLQVSQFYLVLHHPVWVKNSIQISLYFRLIQVTGYRFCSQQRVDSRTKLRSAGPPKGRLISYQNYLDIYKDAIGPRSFYHHTFSFPAELGSNEDGDHLRHREDLRLQKLFKMRLFGYVGCTVILVINALELLIGGLRGVWGRGGAEETPETRWGFSRPKFVFRNVAERS